MERIHKYDTIKGLLAFLVVFAHCLLPLNPESMVLNVFIYSFHMPAFMYLSGMFAKFNLPRAFYLILLFIPFMSWFTLAVGIYMLLIPVLAKAQSRKAQVLVLTGSILLGLASGFVSWLDLTWSGARIFTFLPYFVAGYYRVTEWRPCSRPKAGILIAVLTILTLVCSVALHGVVRPFLMSLPYGANNPPWMRIIAYVLGFSWTYTILNVTPDKRVPILTQIGKYTLYIYLLHLPILDLVTKLMTPYYSLLLVLCVPLAWMLILCPLAHYATKLDKAAFKKLNTWLKK